MLVLVLQIRQGKECLMRQYNMRLHGRQASAYNEMFLKLCSCVCQFAMMHQTLWVLMLALLAACPMLAAQNRNKTCLQGDMSATRKFGGTGLGLNITKSLIEAHGGSIAVESMKGDLHLLNMCNISGNWQLSICLAELSCTINCMPKSTAQIAACLSDTLLLMLASATYRVLQPPLSPGSMTSGLTPHTNLPQC